MAVGRSIFCLCSKAQRPRENLKRKTKRQSGCISWCVQKRTGAIAGAVQVFQLRMIVFSKEGLSC